MASTDEIEPIRKAFSADKSKDFEKSNLFPDIPKEVGNRTFKSCSSASFLSSRSKHRNFQSLLSGNISPNYIKLDSNEDHKLFLNASQTLEKLNRVIVQNSEVSDFDSHISNSDDASNKRYLSLRKIILYHDVLKKLLEERCTLMLREECDVCIKRTVKLIEVFKQLYLSEKLKMMTMPIQASNRFVNCNENTFSALELLIKKLQIICDLHSSISSSYQKIINCFHIGFDMSLYQLVSKTNKTLNKLKCNLFYWAYKSMTIFMKKLCLADPNSVTPDFLQSILQACIIFNLLVKDNKGITINFLKSCDLFYNHSLSYNYAEVPFSLVLNYLAYFEAKIASEKLVHFITSACKKFRHADLKKKNDSGLLKRKCDETSDYSSAATSDLDTENSSVKMCSLVSMNSNLANVWTSIVQRNQSLILKYLYSITSLQNSTTSKRRASHDSNPKFFTVRPVWNLPDQNIQDERYILLEDMYWTNFWTNIQKFILKILFEVPYHQYGDAVAGTIVLWPDNFLQILTECLKLNVDNNDISIEGRFITKQIYEYIYVHRIQLLWDREFSSALSATHLHICSLVPTVLKPVRTYPGNVLYICLDLVLDIFSEDYVDMDSVLLLQSLNQLRSTLDCFNSWANTKTRALMSSQNLSSYLHVSCSDCSSASKLLMNKVIPVLSTDFFTNSFQRMSPTRKQLEQDIFTSINNFAGYETEAQNLFYKLCFATVKNFLTSAIKYEGSWRKCIFPKVPPPDTLETFLFSMDEAMKHLGDIFPLALAVTSAITQAFLCVLDIEKKSLSSNCIQLLSTELSKFLQWLERLSVSETEIEELKQQHNVKKICYLLKQIYKSLSQNRTCLRQRNKVSPIASEMQFDETVLNDREKGYLQRLHTRKIFLCF